MTALIVLAVVFIGIPLGIIIGVSTRISTGRAMRREAARIASLPDMPKPRAGAAWEIERARLIDNVIAPSCGSMGPRLVRQTHIRRRLARILDGTENA
ncbi:hypothetical protein ACLBYG_22440 [Methylobacterium sp. D53M]